MSDVRTHFDHKAYIVNPAQPPVPNSVPNTEPRRLEGQGTLPPWGGRNPRWNTLGASKRATDGEKVMLRECGGDESTGQSPVV